MMIKPLLLFFLLACSFSLKAHVACQRITDTAHYPYKVHLPGEALVSNEVYYAQYRTFENSYLYIYVITAFHYESGRVLKDRKGRSIPASEIEDHIGFFVLSNGIEHEISATQTRIEPDPNPDPTSTSFDYNMQMYYRFKGDPADYSNDTFEVDLRFRVRCSQS